jgi:hypothetical protein
MAEHILLVKANLDTVYLAPEVKEKKDGSDEEEREEEIPLEQLNQVWPGNTTKCIKETNNNMPKGILPRRIIHFLFK